jgi:hypothetical protein
MVRELLGRGPGELAGVGAADDRFPPARGAQRHLQRDVVVERPRLLEIGEQGHLARLPPRAEGPQRLGVTIQGEIVVALALAWNGPSGWYSQACTSRADQSLRRT